MTKMRATAIHLAISLALVTVICSLMLFVWYPVPLFDVLGGHGLLVLIAGVDIILGPLLTFTVFKPAKPGLKLDLAIIAVCQLVALIYGLYTVSVARPAFIVFVQDRFELVRAFDITPLNYEAAKAPKFRSAPWLGPNLISVEFPPAGQEQTALMESSLSGGPDIHLLPKYFANVGASESQIASRAKSLNDLKKLNPTQSAFIDGLPTVLGYKAEDLGFFPFRAIREDIAMIVSRRDGKVLKALVLKPW